MSLDRSFPVQELLFFVAQDLTNSIRAGVRNLVAELAASRKWVIGSPKFVDIAENWGEGVDKVSFETVGGVLEIYSAMPPTALPHHIDLQHLEEVLALIKCVCNFSREQRVAFEFELEGESVGTVVDGEMDNNLREGLLGEWRRYLGVSD